MEAGRREGVTRIVMHETVHAIVSPPAPASAIRAEALACAVDPFF
jgi:hypothetical protein